MIDPAVWAALTEGISLPERGQRIRARLRGGDVVTGVVELLWLAMDTPAVKIACYGGHVNILPDLGDTWEPA